MDLRRIAGPSIGRRLQNGKIKILKTHKNCFCWDDVICGPSPSTAACINAANCQSRGHTIILLHHSEPLAQSKCCTHWNCNKYRGAEVSPSRIIDPRCQVGTRALPATTSKNKTIRLHENMQTETIFVFKPNNRGIYCACMVCARFFRFCFLLLVFDWTGYFHSHNVSHTRIAAIGILHSFVGWLIVFLQTVFRNNIRFYSLPNDCIKLAFMPQTLWFLVFEWSWETCGEPEERNGRNGKQSIDLKWQKCWTITDVDERRADTLPESGKYYTCAPPGIRALRFRSLFVLFALHATLAVD